MEKVRMIKMWVPVEFKKNIQLKQARIKADLGIKIPMSKIAYALSRQDLSFGNVGINPKNLKWGIR